MDRLLNKSACAMRILRLLPWRHLSSQAHTDALPVTDSAESSQQKSATTSVEISTEDFKHVERLLPQTIVPEPPKHASYPTASGWVPPADAAALEHIPYFVQRNRNHNYSLYLEVRVARQFTKLRKIGGDIWALDADIKQYLLERTGKEMLTQVQELPGLIRVRGNYVYEVSDFLKEKGF